jgi:radical SAM protein with 4Fe4S-binding SPASM domain
MSGQAREPIAGGRPLLPLVDRRTAVAGRTQNSCFFRSGPVEGRRKALVKITDRCDLHCAHCFVSATTSGEDLPLESLNDRVLEALAAARVGHVTLTGGEPFVHPQLIEIATRLVNADMDVTVCTNAVNIGPDEIATFKGLGRVQLNVSLDGFGAESHGRFRGSRGSFERTIDNVRQLGRAGLLKGVLCTPNRLAIVDEYTQLQRFAREAGADYLLMNPLSLFGRGLRSQRLLAADDDAMTSIMRATTEERPAGLDVTYVRFPGQREPLAGCIAGDILYVFVNGDVTVCPYLVFAADNPASKHSRDEFIVGNLFTDADIARRLDNFQLSTAGTPDRDRKCGGCTHDATCGKGCPAAVVAAGGRLGDLDAEVCPEVEESAEARCS